jgi:glycosyltransferase involved in cell wall biosynthesis
MRLLYICDADGGGIAEYAIRQCQALVNAGADVTFLCRPTFEMSRLAVSTVIPDLPVIRARDASPLVRVACQISDARAVARVSAKVAAEKAYDSLLIACYAEYFAPLWSSILRDAASNGLKIGTIAHDPVRDFVLGPLWWHRWSIRQAYSFVSHVFVHDSTPVDFGGPKPDHLTIHVIPHGPYKIAAPQADRRVLRRNYGFTDSDTVFLSFGQIRDGKNLDRFLRAMISLPEHVKLLVAGSGGSSSQRPPEHYVHLARELEIADRCVWDLRYIPDAETGNLFEVSDHVLLTYSANFRSASGVLNAAISCRRTVLASSGPGPLRSAVEDYDLGQFVPPDDDSQLLTGALRLLAEPNQPAWDRYGRENSWDRNANGVLEAFASP